MAELKDLIKGRRLAIGKTLEDVATEVGVSKATVLRWESGEIKDMRRDKLVSLSRALQTTPGYLMGWEDNHQPTNMDQSDEGFNDSDIRRIARARKQMPPSEQDRMMKILEVAFDEFFKDDISEN